MKKILAVLIAASVFSAQASAALVKQNEDGHISITGSLGAAYQDTETQIQILGPFEEKMTLSQAAASITATPAALEHTYVNTVLADENGNYSFVYPIKKENQYYLVVLNEPGVEKVQTTNLFIIGKALSESFLTDLNSSDTPEKMKTVLKKAEYQNILTGNRSDYARIDGTSVYSALAAELTAARPFANFSQFESDLVRFTAVQLTNLIQDPEEAKTLAEQKIGISGKLVTLYQQFSETQKKAVMGRMLERNIESYVQYMKILDESIFLEQIEIEKYASNLTELLTSNQNLFNLDLTDYQTYANTVNAALYGKNFKTMDLFKEALSKAISDAREIRRQPSGGNGGGTKTESGNIIVPIGNPTKVDPSQTEGSQTGYFDDLDSVLWAKDAIEALAEHRVVAGKEERKFFPQDAVKREEFVKITVGAFNLEIENAIADFEDVAKSEWYYESIASAFEGGIVSGQSSTLFGVGAQITRQDMAVIVYRAAQKQGMEFDLQRDNFADDEQISDYAKEAVYALKEKGIISGVGENSFEPQRNATRAEAAKMIFSILSLQ